MVPSAVAQTFSVIHDFAGGNDGKYPSGNLVMDRTGNLYGTTSEGGANGYGVVFKLSYHNSGWTLSPLYSFQGGTDGAQPSGVTLGPDGALYGTTAIGGIVGCGTQGCGTVYRLVPAATTCRSSSCPWTETVLYRFSGGTDGMIPGGAPVFDQQGNLFGTTLGGGMSGNLCYPNGCGLIYELTPSQGGWTDTVVYDFTGGLQPQGGLMFDSAGNLYGAGTLVTMGGEVFELTNQGAGWSYTNIWTFTGGVGGDAPSTNVVRDQAGNLYGATEFRDPVFGAGTLYELTPDNGTWIFQSLITFNPTDFEPLGLSVDSTGTLYGTSAAAGLNDLGLVYELTPSGQFVDLHDFAGSDGLSPQNNPLLDTAGNLYGTTWQGGTHSSGVIWEIAP